MILTGTPAIAIADSIRARLVHVRQGTFGLLPEVYTTNSALCQ
jgi:hypothetical protein